MIFGADYYPEHWDKSEWTKQAKLMREANMNTVRMAEFAWSLLEPKEGEFDFSWLDEVIEILAKEGIGVIMGTPSATPPKWLVNKYDIYQRDKYGRAVNFGSRRECCANNDYYIEKVKIITEQMAKHYGKNVNVKAWQIDNEFGCHASTVCYCEHCKNKFAKWLENKYGNISTLNKTYGTVFWSHIYSDFDDIILPAYNSCEPTCGDARSHNPSLEQDFYRFSSDTWVNFEKMQADIIRKYSDYPITHNFMGHFSDIDYYELAKPLDMVSWDAYPDNQWETSEFENVSMAHEVMRGSKNKNFWVMEQQSGPCGWDRFGGTPRPGQIRLWTYQSIAHGAEGIVYFRFRSALFGMEQYWLGLVDHDGIPRRRYYEAQKTGSELARLSYLFEGAKTKSDVLIVKSYDEVWTHRIKCHVDGFDYNAELYRYYRANHHIGANPMCGNEEQISNEYKVVYMPAYSMVTDEICDKLKEYVKNGGTLVLTYRSGTRDKNNNIISETIPGKLRELAGISVYEFDTSKVETKLSDGYGKAKLWRDIMELEGAKALISYESEYYAGTAAITENSYGNGRVFYIGCDLEETALERLTSEIASKANAHTIKAPNGTEIIPRICGDKEYKMLLNYTGEKKNMGISGISLISGVRFTGELDAYEIEIIE